MHYNWCRHIIVGFGESDSCDNDTVYPVVDLLSSGYPFQEASENTTTVVGKVQCCILKILL